MSGEMTDQQVIRVLLVDDQALIRMGFRMVLEAEDDIEVVGEAGDGASAVTQVAALRPDVVLMDVRMPRMDGIEATKQLTAQHPGAKIIVVTTFDLDEYAFAALRAGASGFLLKNAEPRELVEAVRVVHGGDAVISGRVTKRMLDMFAGQLPGEGDGDDNTQPAGQLSQVALETQNLLTNREYEVLMLIARGLSNQEIAGELFVSETTVKTHVGRVLSKLGLRDRVHAVIFAHEHGLE